MQTRIVSPISGKIYEIEIKDKDLHRASRDDIRKVTTVNVIEPEKDVPKEKENEKL